VISGRGLVFGLACLASRDREVPVDIDDQLIHNTVECLMVGVCGRRPERCEKNETEHDDS